MYKSRKCPRYVRPERENVAAASGAEFNACSDGENADADADTESNACVSVVFRKL